MKNNKIYTLFIIVFILGIFLIIKIDNYKDKIHQTNLINNNAKIINALILNHPELEQEIINEITKNKENIDTSFLEKYGLNNNDIISYYIKDDNILYKEIIIYIIFMFFIIILYLLYIKNQNKKIKQIDKYIKDILNNKDTFDIRDYSEDSLSKLKNDIYKITILLKEEKENTLKEKKNLEIILSDISHQIKTPLTSMYVINDLLLDDNLNKQKRKEFLNKNKTQLERIEWLVTSLLKISRLDSGTVKLKKEKVKINELIEKVIEPLKIPIELKCQNLIVDNLDIDINIDLNWTVEALINILKNAHEHTLKKGTIQIRLKDNPIYTEIDIIDNGEGISKNNINHIFERFYKGSNNKESIGIGLNMAKTIIEKENGTIEVESSSFTIFKVKFYK